MTSRLRLLCPVVPPSRHWCMRRLQSHQQPHHRLQSRPLVGGGYRWCSQGSSHRPASDGHRTNWSRVFGAAAGIFVFPAVSWWFVRDDLQGLLAQRRGEVAAAGAAGEASPPPDADIVGELTIVPKPALGGPFVLVDAATGQRLNEHDVFDGRWTLLYFGFTRCAEVCPAAMRFLDGVHAAATSAYAATHPAQCEALRVCFVSIDHLRDKPADVVKFLTPYAVPSIGLVGTRDEVSTAAAAWRVYLSSVDETESEREARESKGVPPQDPLDDAYQLDHSAAVYLVGPDGKLKDFFFKEMGPQAAVDRIGLHFDNIYGINQP